MDHTAWLSGSHLEILNFCNLILTVFTMMFCCSARCLHEFGILIWCVVFYGMRRCWWLDFFLSWIIISRWEIRMQNRSSLNLFLWKLATPIFGTILVFFFLFNFQSLPIYGHAQKIIHLLHFLLLFSSCYGYCLLLLLLLFHCCCYSLSASCYYCVFLLLIHFWAMGHFFLKNI